MPSPSEAGLGRSSRALGSPLVRFGAASALVLVLVGAATVVIARQISQAVALREAESRATTFAQAVGAPLVDARVLDGDRRGLARLTQVMQNRLEDDAMVHIRIWDRAGKVLWADQPGLRGRSFTLAEPVRQMAPSGDSVAWMADPDQPENAFDRRGQPLLEVYVSVLNADRVPILVETYWSTDHIDEDARAILLRMAPLTLGALLLFALALVPLQRSLMHRIAQAQAETERSLHRALAAADLERRRIARDLHDGVMQDLTGAGYALTLAGRSLPTTAEGPRRLIEEVSAVIASAGESLRSMLADIYPPNLARDGLGAALHELAARAAKDGIVVEVDADLGQDETLPLPVSQLCYRAIREALRNVVKHAQASRADVRVSRHEGAVALTVTDDGRGLPDEPDGQEHHGLRLLEDTLHDVGGELAVESAPHGGTVFSAVVPLRMTEP